MTRVLWSLAFLVVWICPTSALTGPSGFRDITSVDVVIEKLDGDSHDYDLEEEDLEKVVVRRLKFARIPYSSSATPYIYVQVINMVLSNKTQHFFSCSVQFKQNIKTEAGSRVFSAITWSKTAIGIVGSSRMPDEIEDLVRDLVEELMEDYLDAHAGQ